MKVKGYAAMTPGSLLVPWEFTRRELKENDVQIEILYSGICHSDIHQVKEEWGESLFPMVPGHEIVGKVERVGSKVKNFTQGQIVGVGVYIDSCRKCENCLNENSNYCIEGMTGTYNGFERDGKTVAQGGYSTKIVIDEKYVVRVPENLDQASVAPLLCAGITLYSPLKHWGAAAGKKVAIVGLGGLGHLGVKFANALGAEVTVISHSLNKKSDALKLGAINFVSSKNLGEASSYFKYFDIIINTVSVPIDLNEYLELLKLNGVLVMVGLSGKPYPIDAFKLLDQRRRIAGSMIGSVEQLQEMLDFAGQNEITSEIELIPATQINEAYQRVIQSDVKYRFVIDASTFN